MEFARQIPRRLHDEHLASLGVFGRFEQWLGRASRQAPATLDASTQAMLREVDSAVDASVLHHFDFEETHLFPLLASHGERDIVAILSDEHEAIREVTVPVRAAVRKLLAGQIEPSAWPQFRALGFELVERLVAHIQKEEMALLPALEDGLTDEADRELTNAYAQAT